MLLPPARLLPASAAALAVLLGVSGCLSRSDSASSSGHVSTALTASQAQAALIDVGDLGKPWGPTDGAATWRDGLLKAQASTPQCQRLLDSLYADELLGATTGPHAAVTALDDGNDAAQLRYQVATRRPADVDRALAWLKSMPKKCAQFTAETVGSGTQDVQVTGITLPRVGNARQGLRIRLASENNTNDDGSPVTLTLDVAAVRAGDDAIVLTDGAFGAPPQDTTGHALQLGTRRLAQVRERARAQA